MFALRSVFGALAVAGVLSACSSSVPLNDNKVQVEDRTPKPAQQDANAGQGNRTSESEVKTVDLGKSNETATDLQRAVYFDFDSYVVKDDYRPIIEAHAKRLAADRKKKLSLEGHTDERGGREYNLALGQKRAEAVAKSLTLLGVADNQVEAVSFGKERPAAQGSDEAAWAKNRRVELKDR